MPARQPDSRDGQADPRGTLPARPGEGGDHRRGRAHHRGGGGGQEAARAPLEERRASGATAEDHRGRALGRNHHGDGRRADHRARPAGGRQDLGLSSRCDGMKALFWVLVAIGCVYVFYTGAMAVWSYLEITKKVAASGIKLADRGVSVSDEGRTLDVSVRWSWPVIVYQGERVFAIPLKHERTFKVPEKR